MKISKRSLVVALVAVLAVLALIGMAEAQGPVTDAQGGRVTDARAQGKGVPALDKVDTFLKTLQRAGFTSQEGKLEYLDATKEACLGTIPDALGNNPLPNTYLTIRIPQPEGIDFELPVHYMWQLREDEAMVLIGQTPPAAAYFSYQSWVAFLPQDHTRRSVAFGDATNINTIRTIGPERANRPIVYIITGNRTTEQRVRAAVLAAGYPDAIINVERLSQVIAPLGLGPTGSILFFGHRVAVPESDVAMAEYRLHPPYRVFRVTPQDPSQADPEPVPVLRVRGTGHTEMALYPALKRLQGAILAQEKTAHPALNARVLNAQIWQATLPGGQLELIEKPWVGLQLNTFLWAGTRDTNYIQTAPYFKLRAGAGEYVIVYGVNHHKTGKATYANVSVYVEPNKATGAGREFGLATLDDRKFDDSARHYLPDDPEADMLYALKVARDCGGEEHCLTVKMPNFVDINGASYVCEPPIDLENSDMYIVFRAYLEPATNAGPDDNELLWDRAIYFGTQFTGQ